jgi:hypothetical protein
MQPVTPVGKVQRHAGRARQTVPFSNGCHWPSRVFGGFPASRRIFPKRQLRRLSSELHAAHASNLVLRLHVWTVEIPRCNAGTLQPNLANLVLRIAVGLVHQHHPDYIAVVVLWLDGWDNLVSYEKTTPVAVSYDQLVTNLPKHS